MASHRNYLKKLDKWCKLEKWCNPAYADATAVLQHPLCTFSSWSIHTWYLLSGRLCHHSQIVRKPYNTWVIAQNHNIPFAILWRTVQSLKWVVTFSLTFCKLNCILTFFSKKESWNLSVSLDTTSWKTANFLLFSDFHLYESIFYKMWNIFEKHCLTIRNYIIL